MKKLRRIAGGDTYTIIYLKLQLLSLKDEGLLYYEGVEPTFYEEMALALDEDAENVRATLIFLENMGLISRNNEHEYILTEVPYLIGSETDKAELMRKKRERERLQSSNNVTAVLPPVTNCYTEIEIDKDIDIDIEKDIELEKSKSKREKTPPKETKHKYGEYNNVLLTDTELEKLKAEYTDYEARIDRLSGYIESKGAKYKSHYATIRNWARKDAEQGKAKSTKAQELDNFYNMASEWAESED
jgi:predicted phage replisome organizer